MNSWDQMRKFIHLPFNKPGTRSSKVFRTPLELLGLEARRKMSTGKRKALTLEQRIQVLKKIDAGLSVKELSKEFDCGKTQIFEIRRKRQELKQQWETGGRADQKHTKRRKTNFDDLNSQVWDWFCETRSRQIPLTGRLIQEKALMLSVELKLDDFSASNGWLDSWKKRYNVTSFVLSGGEHNIFRVQHGTQIHPSSAVSATSTELLHSASSSSDACIVSEDSSCSSTRLSSCDSDGNDNADEEQLASGPVSLADQTIKTESHVTKSSGSNENPWPSQVILPMMLTEKQTFSECRHSDIEKAPCTESVNKEGSVSSTTRKRTLIEDYLKSCIESNKSQVKLNKIKTEVFKLKKIKLEKKLKLLKMVRR